MKIRTLAPALTIAAALTLAACSTGEDAPAENTEATQTQESAPAEEETEEMTAAAAQFGPACADIPADGPGSFDGMAQDPVATAASNNPALSTLVEFVTAAELGDTLNGAENITVFAPANSAFEALPKETADAAAADPSGLLTEVLTYHVVPETLTPEDLAGTFTTLNGAELTIEGSGEEFTVGAAGASVVCGNVQTANATVYIIDGVLLPPMK